MKRLIGPEELFFFYASVGECLWHIQNLEDALIHLLHFKLEARLPQSITQEESDRLILEWQKKPLGTLISIAFEKQAIEGILRDRFTSFQGERNWLVHRAVAQNRKDLHDSDKTQSILLRIHNLRDEAVALRRLVGDRIDNFCRSLGVDVAKMHQDGLRNLKRSMGIE